MVHFQNEHWPWFKRKCSFFGSVTVVIGAMVLGYSLFVPLCDYFGAKKKVNNMLHCFYQSNICGAICMVIVPCYIAVVKFLFSLNTMIYGQAPTTPTFYISIALSVLQFNLYVYGACLAKNLTNNPISNVVVVQQQVVATAVAVAQPEWHVRR